MVRTQLGLGGNVAVADQDIAWFLLSPFSMAQRGFIRRAHRAGKKVFVWTVNDPVTKSRLLAHAAVMFGKPLPQRAYRDESP